MALHYVLDGYNIVKNLAALADRKLEDGRQGLIDLVNRYRPQGSQNNDVTIVFDGQADLAGGFYQQSGIRIIFSNSGCADDKIKQLIDQAKFPKTCVVVTNDREIQYYVRAAGARVMAVEEFTSRLKPDYLRLKKNVATEDKQISKVTELKINEEMQDIWLRPKRANG